jgi:hypothetical protein
MLGCIGRHGLLDDVGLLEFPAAPVAPEAWLPRAPFLDPRQPAVGATVDRLDGFGHLDVLDDRSPDQPVLIPDDDRVPCGERCMVGDRVVPAVSRFRLVVGAVVAPCWRSAPTASTSHARRSTSNVGRGASSISLVAIGPSPPLSGVRHRSDTPVTRESIRRRGTRGPRLRGPNPPIACGRDRAAEERTPYDVRRAEAPSGRPSPWSSQTSHAACRRAGSLGSGRGPLVSRTALRATDRDRSLLWSGRALTGAHAGGLRRAGRRGFRRVGGSDA